MLVVFASIALLTCGESNSSQPAQLAQEAAPVASSEGTEVFTDRAEEVGIDFVHFNGMSGAFYIPEILAPGAALLDFDNDGDLDVFLVQGRMLGPDKTLADAARSRRRRRHEATSIATTCRSTPEARARCGSPM